MLSYSCQRRLEIKCATKLVCFSLKHLKLVQVRSRKFMFLSYCLSGASSLVIEIFFLIIFLACHFAHNCFSYVYVLWNKILIWNTKHTQVDCQKKCKIFSLWTSLGPHNQDIFQHFYAQFCSTLLWTYEPSFRKQIDQEIFWFESLKCLDRFAFK